MEPVVIQAERLSRSYDGVPALCDVSFELRRGQVLGYLGPNGAGKSTTVRILLGLLAPSGGSVRVLGLDPRRDGLEVRRRTGVVFDSAGHYGRLSVESNLKFFARLYGAHQDQVERLLETVGLAHRRRDPVERLSRGMKQRLALARALVHAPEVLILDEPTAGLDPLAARQVRALIGEFRAGGGSVLLTTHYLEEADQLCDTIVILDAGSILAQGSPQELKQSYLDGPGTLEDVFLKVAGRSLYDPVEDT